jgi:ABC-type nitrate/sulfonate/bicarbonate transport system permease component
VALGATIGVSATVGAWLQPMLEVIRLLPALAILPLARA